MERPTKRARVHEEIDVHEARRANDLRLKSRFEDIFKKYGRDFGTVGDEIDLRTGEIIVNNGHLQEMDNEQDVGRGLWDDFHPDDDESERENVPCEQEIQLTKSKSRSSHKKPKADNFVTADLLSLGPPHSENPDIDPVWKTPNIESRFSTTMNITTPTPKQAAVKPRPRSPPSSGSIWAASQKRHFQNRRVERQGQHSKASERRGSPDSDDPLIDESVPTPARTPSLVVKKRLDASNLENTVTSDQADAHTPDHEEPMAQSVKNYYGKAKETMEKGSPSRSADQPLGDQSLGEVNGIPHVEHTLTEVSEAPPFTEIAQLSDAPTDNGPSGAEFSSALPSDRRELLAEQIDINHDDINEPINQESHVAPLPAKKSARKITTSGVQDICEVVIYQQAATKPSEYRPREVDKMEGYTNQQESPGKPPSEPLERPPDKPRTNVTEGRNRATDLTSESVQDTEDAQKETVSRQSPHTSESPSKNQPEILSPHEVKTIVDLRFLQKLPWRKIFERSDIRRPTSRQLKHLYQVRNALSAGGSGEFPPWATEKQERLKAFLPTRIDFWDEIYLSFPEKSTAEIQHEWIRVCLENGSNVPPEVRHDSQLGGSSVLPATPSRYPNVASSAQGLSTPQQQARLGSDNESNRSESPDPLSVAFQRSWIGSGLSAMQIDTPPRPSRSKENNRSPSRGSLTSSTKRSLI